MQYLWQHLEHILQVYDGKLPLHHFLKGYFKSHPKLGSRDRRGLSDAVYAWYRAGKALENDSHDLPTKRLMAMQLCGLKPKAFDKFFPEAWTTGGTKGTEGFSVDLDNIFPFELPFSEGMTKEAYQESMLRQPRMFLRIRNNQETIREVLIRQAIAHEWLSDTCLALPNSTNIKGLFPEHSYVVQDASSQATGQYLHGKAGEQWWDTCAGAGGKSLMLADATNDIQLLSTDIRQSILQNLGERFRRYQLALPERKVLDAANYEQLALQLGQRRFEGIICDVPCSGSGTWARTPEGCYFFHPDTLQHYTSRQAAILSNATRYLSPGGRIVYITCSVFRAENEDIVHPIAKERGLRIEISRLINGIPIGADSLYVAVLQLG